MNMLMKAPGSTNVGPAGLPGDGLGHQRLARAGRAPQQEAARHVAALGLDLVRLLQEHDVLADPLDHVVLAPDVGEAGLDVVRVVGVDATAREQQNSPMNWNAMKKNAKAS